MCVDLEQLNEDPPHDTIIICLFEPFSDLTFFFKKNWTDFSFSVILLIISHFCIDVSFCAIFLMDIFILICHSVWSLLLFDICTDMSFCEILFIIRCLRCVTMCIIICLINFVCSHFSVMLSKLYTIQSIIISYFLVCAWSGVLFCFCGPYVLQWKYLICISTEIFGKCSWIEKDILFYFLF